MSLEDLTIKEIKELRGLLGENNLSLENNPFRIGEKYIIRTVTLYYTGKLKAIYKHELVLDEAAWIPDTGRFYDALSTGKLNEVEPIIGPVILSRGAIIDVIEWKNVLPCSQK